MLGARAIASLGLASLAAAQFPPKPEGQTVLQSKFHENVTISYKEPGLCETTPGVKSYAGYVHLPPGFLDDELGGPQDYPINTFFWFFEARKNPHDAPLAIWLNGGPGGSSLIGLLMENGPCFIAEDSASTTLNPYSWNNEVNMLYIDQPNQVGLSYDTPTNCTVTLAKDDPSSPSNDGEGTSWRRGMQPADFSDGDVPASNATFRVGTCASLDMATTANTTAQAAHALWHFAQTWFAEFPHYRPGDDRVSLWAESYGGHYGPAFMRFFQQQNERIANGTIGDDSAHALHLDTLGVVNGYIDTLAQEEAYIDMGYNNTYDVQLWNETVYSELRHNFTRPGGCLDEFRKCQSLVGDTLGPKSLCSLPAWCGGPGPGIFYETHPRGYYDIAHPYEDPFPPPRISGWLADADVLAALGSPVNFTFTAPAVAAGFDRASDLFSGGLLDSVASLLDDGVKVHLMYGDRDYSCNWMGGEAASLAVNYSRAGDFAAAGYAPFLAGETVEVAGLTRQLGNLSFTRVFQAGHMVPAYQPEASYDLFMRATFGRDIPTGLLPVFDEYVTVGPSDVRGVKNEVPEFPESRCYILFPESCTRQVWAEVEKGTAIIKDYYVVGFEDESEQEDFMGEL